jgi:Family of unknown function (DUF5683)
MKRLILLLNIFFLFLITINAQKIDSLKVDSLKIVQKDSLPTNKAKFIPVPKKALLYSIIPGGGQIYNRKYWYIKLPLVYGGLATGIYFIQRNGKYYRYFRDNYYRKLNTTTAKPLPLDNSLVPNIERLTQDVLKNARDSYFKTYQQTFAGVAIGYILVAAEAFTAAHLMNFDVNPDLSFHLKPSFEILPIGNANAMGLGVQLKF